jgi:hypothetical protein
MLNDDMPSEPHKAQFASAPNQARKAATVEEALEAAAALKPHVGQVRKIARERRAALAQMGKNALPPDQW